jgi:hypothetical protein
MTGATTARRGTVAAVALAVTGLALGFWATAGSGPHVSPGSAASARLAVQVPAWALWLPALAVAGLMLLVLWNAIPRPRRRRDDELELYEGPRKLTVTAALALLALLTLPVAGVVLLVLHQPAPELAAPVPHVSRHRPAPSAPGTTVRERRGAPVTSRSWPLFNRVLTVVAACVGVGLLAVLLWLWLGYRRLLGGDHAPVLQSRAPPALADAVDQSIEDLSGIADPRLAIVSCYRRFETVLSQARCPRRPWMTPGEFLTAALARMPVPPDAARELTGLFELARFSDHALDTAAREAARRALGRIRAAIARPQHPGEREP